MHDTMLRLRTAGAIFGVRSLAPILGFLLGAWTNSIYVDLSGSFADISIHVLAKLYDATLSRCRRTLSTDVSDRQLTMLNLWLISAVGRPCRPTMSPKLRPTMTGCVARLLVLTQLSFDLQIRLLYTDYDEHTNANEGIRFWGIAHRSRACFTTRPLRPVTCLN